MNATQTRERILLNNRENGRQEAVAEALALKYRYEGSFYTFEYGSRFVTARFITACLHTTVEPFNGYRIELITPHEILVDGPCAITNIHGRKVNAVAFTTRGDTENLITIETTALQSSVSQIN